MRLPTLFAPLPPAQWHPVADLPSKLHHNYLYVLLPSGKVMQALYADFDTAEPETKWAWGQRRGFHCIDPLPVQPTHFFSPPQPPTV